MTRQLSLFELRDIQHELRELEELDDQPIAWTDERERQAGGKWRDSDRLLDGEEVIVSPLLCEPRARDRNSRWGSRTGNSGCSRPSRQFFVSRWGVRGGHMSSQTP